MAMATAVALTGCSSEAKPAARNLPERTCFGVFERSDLAPLLGTGEKVTVSGPPDAQLSPIRRGGTCTVAVDGPGRFLATVTRQPLGRGFFWNREFIHPAPDPVPLGDEAMVYNTGARAFVTCKGRDDQFELEVAVSGSVEQMKYGEGRPLFIKLITKLLDSAKQQSKCGE
ncbi:hypothetical protein ACFWAR_32100 [Streptomyces sp. NPDC059917]|uniref:hypothetical protein n=1 Tax=Streptomyces sp. NPDC059917 TaxID=3347002 RepID=UPI003656330B